MNAIRQCQDHIFANSEITAFRTLWLCHSPLWILNWTLQEDDNRGVHPLWGHDAFPLVSDFCPLFPKHFSDSVVNFPGFTSSEKKISYHLFKIIFHKFEISLYFRSFGPIPSVSNKSFIPLLSQIAQFRKISVFCTCFLWFSFSPTFTTMHLCITQCTYWTPLDENMAIT